MIPRRGCEREREKGERERKKERGKVIKKIMDGSLLQLQRTNSHFQFAPGGGGQSQLSLQPSAGSLPVPGLVPRYSPSSRRILFLGPLPSLPPPYPSTTRDFPSKNLSHHESYGRGSIRGIHPTSSWSNEFHPRARRVEMEKEKGREGGVFIDRNIVPRRFRAAMVGRKEHSELIPSNDALA